MRRLLIALTVWLGLLAPVLAQSTVNPSVPAVNAPLNSAPVRSNFAAAYGDINGLLGMHAVPLLANCPVSTTIVGTDCLVKSSPTAYLWYKYASLANGYVLIGTINPSTSPPIFASGSLINAGFLVANCTGSPAVGTGCSWNTFANQVISSSNGNFPYRTGGSWGVASTGTSGHTIPFLDSTGLIFSNPVTSGVAGTIVGGFCMANATSGSICLAPTTGTLGTSIATFPANSGVVAELNLAQTWTAVQKFNLNAVALQGPLTGTVLQFGNVDGISSRAEIDSYASTGIVTCVRADGTNASPTTLQTNDEICSFNAWGYNGSAYVGGAARVSIFAAQNWSVGANGSYIRLGTIANGAVAGTPLDRLGIENDGGLITFNNGVSPTGGSQGTGTLNLFGSLYNNGVAPTGTGGYVRATSPTFSGTVAGANTIPNSVLVNSSLTIGSTSVTLGATVTTFAGMTLTSPTINAGALSGTFSGTPTFSGNVIFSADPVFSGLASGTCTNGLAINASNQTIIAACPGAAASLQVGTTTITSGTSHGLLTNNAGVLGNTAAGSAGQCDSSGGGSADPSFKSGCWVLLNTLTANNTGTTLADTTSISATYTEYEIVLENIVNATNNTTVEFQVQVGGTFQNANYVSTSNNANGAANGTTSITTGVGVGIASLMPNTAPGVSGRYMLSNPAQTSNGKMIFGEFAFLTGTAASTGTSAGVYIASAGAVTGIQLTTSAGNLVSGVMKIYGRQS